MTTIDQLINVEKREKNGSVPASKNGKKREENGKPRACKLTDLLDKDGKVGHGRPPIEHRFQPGNPGGPGRPTGSRSMRKLIRAFIYDDRDGYYSKAIVKALVLKAINGNTHAIRLICENGNNRRKR